MTDISYNLSGRINPLLVNILGCIQQETTARGIPFVVVGATARDWLIYHGHNIPVGRGTLDLDIGVEVAGWEEFQQLKDALIESGKFAPTREPHRLSCENYFVDIVPYGGVSADTRNISWPPEHQVMMNIMAFQEAYESGVIVRLSADPPLDVKVPTIPGMALMKLISWDDDYPHRSKDAEDLLFLMVNYAEVGNVDRLFDEETELLKQEEFDLTQAGVRLLGRDMAAMANKETGEAVKMILLQEIDERQRCRLVTDMVRGVRIKDSFDETMLKLKKLTEGFAEALAKEGVHELPPHPH
ncbi:hypothetical protein JCM30471_29540 [Desulfuromonas carbonis]|uniref:nucleotidyl transferase AbiEii/AbiGii toxin family protein n=1 Tax=Desulfuromonas sp. DDH964 TaxID=1823759 RepID=UPI00078BFA41|nr:nucleotidyl transferase AbiEii/AbiGii toxin family protein [Desulfuromonas sp. DDH964]AMV71131.1 hypothetical protein DBW_0747 [Desulfuromonas sp. DDH964]